MGIVRRAARDLTGADGATFILRDGDLCYYADENAIAPLWKGKRFPMTTCISGWVMLNKRPAIIKDIYSDPRIPVDAYEPTFVKSLAMVPIRTVHPVGAIGNYWSTHHEATPSEVELLQALADSTSIALENVQLYSELEARVQERTAQLEEANKELEAFSYSASHDLRAPLRHIDGYRQRILDSSATRLDDDARAHLEGIRRATDRMYHLIDDLLRFSQVMRSEVYKEPVDLSSMARMIATELQRDTPDREVDVFIEDGVTAKGDPRLLHLVLENLFSNAWKFSSREARARIVFGTAEGADGECIFVVEDNGAGFDMAHADRLFGAFQRLHTGSEFPGTGVGLATVQRIIQKHGGRIWAEAVVGEGAKFSFTLS